MSVATYTKAGAKATTAATLDKKVFGLKVTNHQLLKEAYLTYLGNGRTAAAKTKKRGEVSGGGRKPWRQKGTGNARFGSSRNPIWRGGGIAFGPTGEQNYTAKLSTQAKRQALRQALSLANNSDKIAVIDDMIINSAKTKDAAALLGKINATGSVLIVVDSKTPELVRATRNLGDIKLVQARYLNVFDILNADKIVFGKTALTHVSDWLGADK
jgi:large subunit ribosomal protein L4